MNKWCISEFITPTWFGLSRASENCHVSEQKLTLLPLCVVWPTDDSVTFENAKPSFAKTNVFMWHEYIAIHNFVYKIRIC